MVFAFLKKIIIIVLSLVGFFLPQWLNLDSAEFLTEKSTVEKKGVGLKSYTKHLFQGVELEIFEENKMSWIIDANSAQNETLSDWNFSNLKGEFFGEKSAKINFSSDKGLLNQSSQKLYLKKNVKAVSSRGYNFETDSLDVFKGDEDTLFESEDPVLLYTKPKSEFNVKAVGFSGALNSGVFNLLSEVRCEKKTEKYDTITINSDKAEMTSSLKSIRFYENLNVAQNEFKIKGQEAYFFLGHEDNEVEAVRVLGDIVASDGTKTALSDRVELKVKEDAIIFQGSPRIRVGDNEMVGEEILITNNQKNVQVIRGNIKTTNEKIELEDE